MVETIIVSKTPDKKKRYTELIPQLKALTSGEDDLVANLSNVAAALKEVFDFFWVGFYLVKANELVLGPFQGPVACTRISFGSGVCGKAWENKETIIVPNVEKFPGHIACSAESKSEIVVPAILNGKVIFVLDVDSDELSCFDNTDKTYLEEIVELLLNNS